MAIYAAPGVVAAAEAPQQWDRAVALMQSKDYAAAVPLLEELRASNPAPNVLWNLATSAAEAGQHAKAIDVLLLYRKLDPGNWEARVKLVRSYEALGDRAARDRERAELLALWRSGTNPDLSKLTFYVREKFNVDGRPVVAVEHFKPEGPTMVVYAFLMLGDDGRPSTRVSLGSYDITNQVALELGERPKDKRLYHLDLYRGKAHQTHGWFLGEPEYDTVRKMVPDVFTGKSKPSSSSRMP